MNISTLRTYAPQARRDFIQAITDRAAFYGLTPTKSEPVTVGGDVAVIAGREHPRSVAGKRKRLEERVGREGFSQTMEVLAYTWFNRFVAIRFMELHGYLDHGFRVLSHPQGNATPEILEKARFVDLPGLKKDVVLDLLLAGDKEPELYRRLLVAQCNGLHRAMPFLFERIDDETELLLPDNLLHTDSLVRRLVAAIDENDWKDVEIIGWLYQFYIHEKKKDVFAGLEKNQKITPENIPAATQLFTPHWIVRYLVENSVGRLWMLNNPESKLTSKMNYYVAPPEVEEGFPHISSPEEIKICDPACGSGHMLTYAFDLLYEIYQEAGYTVDEIAPTILTQNLFGIEIDDRASALAAFAVVMKAAYYDRRILRSPVQPNICALRNVSFDSDELNTYIEELGSDLFTANLRFSFRQFTQANNLGSLIIPTMKSHHSEAARHIAAKQLEDNLLLREIHGRILSVLRMIDFLSQKYQVVIANPPYMGSSGMNDSLKSFGKTTYPDCWGKGRSDTFAMFIDRGMQLVVDAGFVAMVTMESWMFLGTYKELRRKILLNTTIRSMVHMPYLGKGGTSMGINFGTTAFICQTNASEYYRGLFSCVRYYETDEFGVPLEFPAKNERLSLASGHDFLRLPGTPISYWLSKKAKSCFDAFPPFAEVAVACQGLATTENARFVRMWSEVSVSGIGFGSLDSIRAASSNKKWFPMDKGGDYRKWYGNNFAVVNWENDGREIKRCIIDKYPYLKGNPDFVAKNPSRYFQPGVTWGKITSGAFSARFSPTGAIFSDAGMKAFPMNGEDYLWILALLNSKVAPFFLSAFSETMNFEQGNIARIPVASIPTAHLSTIIELSRRDWDSHETSWDFSTFPLIETVTEGGKLDDAFEKLCSLWRSATSDLLKLEEENNKIIISSYGLQEELDSSVKGTEISLSCNPEYRYGGRKSDSNLEEALCADTVREFMSYAVGCMFGRYSLDKPGLILANQGDGIADYFAKVPVPTFIPSEDAIIPLLDRDWFDNDASPRFEEFLRVTFGDKHFSENLAFVETAIGKAANKFFVRDFFADHLKRYKKRPIYWLFSSGPERAFQCLVYLHRYKEGTLARMRTEYVIPLQGKMVSRIDQLEGDKAKATSASHARKLQKEQDDLKRQQKEIAGFEERLRHAADKRIVLDLDDGVKANYAKFGDLLAESKAVIGAEDEE